MRTQADLLIVGAGLYGAVCAYEMTRMGHRCVVIERRDHVGGNCHTQERDGIHLHRYGAHIFHTSNKEIWDWINQFARFNHYRHRVRVNFKGAIHSFPPNLATFHQLWGVRTPEEARMKLRRVREPDDHSETLESWALSRVGREVYDIFIRGYSAKQWNRPACELPASIIKRVPVRLTFDDSYFGDPHQGIPVGGYTGIFMRLLEGVEVKLGVDYFKGRGQFDSMARRVLYTGPIDQFFDYRFGRLEYRSMTFEHQRLDMPDFQGVSVMNYTDEEVPYTRIIEHKHFEFGTHPLTWISREYSHAGGEGREPMYPVRDAASKRAYEAYQALSRRRDYERYHFGGRLAEYQYYDMHQVIGAALKQVREIDAALRRS